MRLRPVLFASLLAAAGALPSWAATYYVAPKSASVSETADGSLAKPWPDLVKALRKAKAGDTILLKDGDYAGVQIKDIAFTAPVTVRSMNGKKARLEWLDVEGSSRNIVFQNLSIWPSNPGVSRRNRVDADGDDLVFDGLDVRSTVDASAYPTWGKAKWDEVSIKGFQSRGDRVTVKNSTFTGLGFAMVLMGPDTQAIGNVIRGFSGDGLRVLGNGSSIKGNVITDCVRINANHPDGMQSWVTNGSSVKDLTIEGNAIIEWSNPTKSRLRCELQGIGFFDGFYDNLVIRNNVISVTAYHGISVYGARNAEVINNTVVNGKGSASTYPWIGVFKHKNGSPSQDVMVANNLAMGYHGKTNVTNRRTYTANSTITYPAKVFTDVTKFNYLPKVGSGFIDNGATTVAPKVDIRSYKRPAGKGPDRGAYETGSTLSTSTQSSETLRKWLSTN